MDESQNKFPKTVISCFAYGGIHWATNVCLIRDACRAVATNKQLIFMQPQQDALIDRCRAIVVQRFLRDTDADILIMVDHDIEWKGANQKTGYDGDLWHLAERAHEHQAIVGAMICKKVKHQGIASFVKEQGEYKLGQDKLLEAFYVGSGMTAYPRKLLQDVCNTMPEIAPGYPPIFMPITVDHPARPGEDLALSEDWALCHRAQDLGYKSYISLRPLTTHWGEYGFTVGKDSNPEINSAPPMTEVVGDDVQPEWMRLGLNPPVISLLHATRGRQKMAIDTCKKFKELASGLYTIEYIYSVDDDDDIEELTKQGNVNIISGNNRGNVDAYNRAAYNSTGDILIQVHDDIVPPPNWDKLIVDKIGDYSRNVVLAVDDGIDVNPQKKDWLATILIGTTAYFKQAGYFYYPEYVSLYCDDDISMKAFREGCLVSAKDIKFLHKWEHPSQGDETRKRSYDEKNWIGGKEIFNKRLLENFANHPEMWPCKKAA